MVNFLVENWDSDQTGAQWDAGLDWDTNVGPSLGDTAPYLSLITSEHNQRPKFMATVESNVQPYADNIAVLQSMSALFDIDEATGQQLDIVGQWVGVTRDITTPLTGVYFSFDDPALGFDRGTWFNEFNPISGIVHLSDDAYRTLLRARVVNNRWDGTIPGAYAVWDIVFSGTGIDILVQDLENMHMILALTGQIPDAVTLALFHGGYLNLKPATVKIDAYITPSAPGVPYFGFDVENSAISGFDTGAFGVSS